MRDRGRRAVDGRLTAPSDSFTQPLFITSGLCGDSLELSAVNGRPLASAARLIQRPGDALSLSWRAPRGLAILAAEHSQHRGGYDAAASPDRTMSSDSYGDRAIRRSGDRPPECQGAHRFYALGEGVGRIRSREPPTPSRVATHPSPFSGARRAKAAARAWTSASLGQLAHVSPARVDATELTPHAAVICPCGRIVVGTDRRRLTGQSPTRSEPRS